MEKVSKEVFYQVIGPLDACVRAIQSPWCKPEEFVSKAEFTLRSNPQEVIGIGITKHDYSLEDNERKEYHLLQRFIPKP